MSKNQAGAVTILEDKHDLIKRKKVLISTSYLYCDPIDNIFDTEELEEYLTMKGVDYVLAQLGPSNFGLYVEKKNLGTKDDIAL